MDEENKKIDIGSFFGRLNSVEEMANSAILKSDSNLEIINQQKLLIENISVTIENLKTEIQEINNYIVIQKDAEEDRRFEEEDARQKQEMSDRASSLKGGGTGAAAGAAAGSSTEGNEFGKDPVKKGGLFSGFRQIGNLFNLGRGLAISSLGGLVGMAEGGEVKDNDKDTTNNDKDSVLAALTPGEFVIKKDAVKKIGIDTLKGLNAAAGGKNKSEDIKVFEEENFKRRTDMSGGGMDQETVTRETITEDDGSVLTTEERLRERIVSVGVPDLIEHKTQLLSEIHKLDGFEKVTIDDVINRTTGIPQDKLFDILNKSNAAKATEKKQEDAINEDYKARNIKPGKGFSIGYDDPVAKSLKGTMGYRIGQINPDQLVMSIDELTEKSTLTTKETFKSAKDPKFKEAHANAKKSGGVKGYSEGGLVGEDIKGNKTNPMDIFSGITKSLEDLTKSPLAKEMKSMADNDTLGLKDMANKASEIMGGKEGLGDFKDNIMDTVKDRLLGGEESSNLLQKIESAFDKIEGIIPTEDDMEELTQSDGSPSVKLPSSSGNKGALVQKDRPNVTEVEIKQAISDIAFVNLARLQSGQFNNIKNINESDLPASVRNLLKIK